MHHVLAVRSDGDNKCIVIRRCKVSSLRFDFNQLGGVQNFRLKLSIHQRAPLKAAAAEISLREVHTLGIRQVQLRSL